MSESPDKKGTECAACGSRINVAYQKRGNSQPCYVAFCQCATGRGDTVDEARANLDASVQGLKL